MDISIILPSFNRCDDLRRCLLSIAKQKNCTAEIIVVDDGSTDSTVEMVKTEFPNTRLFRNEGNLGPGYARNVGIINAKGKYLLILDSDTELHHPLILANFIDFFQKHPDVGCVGGEIKQHNNSDDRVFGRLIAADGNSTPISISNRARNYAECDFLATCCCMLKTELAIKIGGLDHYYGFGAEDKDFGYRIKQAGYTNYVSADCAVKHHHSPGGRSLDETFKYQKTRMRFVLKCFPFGKKVYACLLWMWRAIFFYLTMPVKLSLYLIKGKPLVKENFLGGYMILKAFFENLVSIKEIKTTRTLNFLDPKEMRCYVRKSSKYK